MKERLLQIANHLGISIRGLENLCGLQRGNISNMSEGGAIGSDKLAKIIDGCPDINPEWLITGKGGILREQNKNEVSGNSNTSVAGNGNNVTAAIHEMYEIQKGYQEIIRKNQEQMSETQKQLDRLISIIEKAKI